jgi:putative peptidoglycan lipid II flippase
MAAPTTSATRRIALAVMLIALGNVASRLIGFIREGVLAGTFGVSLDVDAFTAASALTTILYDLLISGALSAALVPVFSEYAERDEQELWRVASTIFNLVLLVMFGLVALLAWQAPLAIALLAGGFPPQIRDEATLMLRLLLPSVIAMSLAGLITAVLQARQRFFLPSFTTSAFNLGIIAGVVLLTATLGPLSMVVGVLIGAVLQVLLQLPGLRGASYRPVIELDHPGVRRILKLYAPVAVGIGFSIIGIVLDRNLASQVGESALSIMRYATTLIQLPLGLVAAAISFAILPTLSRQAGTDEEGFRTTLAMGLKVVLLLMLPATIGLLALAEPIARLLFERGRFTGEDSQVVAMALRLYLPGLPAAAIDQLLLFAFYARRRTLAPNLVQGVAIGFYIITALGLLALTSLRVEALVLGNSAQWVAHMLIMTVLARRLIDFGGLRIGETLLKCGLAALGLGIVAWGLATQLAPWGPFVQLMGAGLLGGMAYLGACFALRVEALGFFLAAVRRRIRR